MGGLCPLECTPSFLGLWHRMLIWRTFSVSVPPGAVPAPSPSPSGVLVTRFHASRSRPPADTGVECPALGCSVLLPLRSRPLRFAGSEVPTGVSSRLRTLLPAVSSPCAGCPVCPREPLACASEARPVPGPTLSTARPARPGSDARSSSTLCCFLPFFFFWLLECLVIFSWCPDMTGWIRGTLVGRPLAMCVGGKCPVALWLGLRLP